MNELAEEVIEECRQVFGVVTIGAICSVIGDWFHDGGVSEATAVEVARLAIAMR